MPLDDRPSLTATEAAIVDLENTKAAMAKRMQTFGVVQSPADPDTITDYDRALYGRPVRIEIDVTVPLAELKRQLNTVRAEMTNAIAELERGDRPAHDRRFSVHRRLCAAKVYVFQSRQEIKLRRKALDK
jgi:hypothetical protein